MRRIDQQSEVNVYYIIISKMFLKGFLIYLNVGDINSNKGCQLEKCQKKRMINTTVTAKLLKQAYRYHKIGKPLSKFYRRHSGLVKKYVSLKNFLQPIMSEPEFYGDLVDRFRKIEGNLFYRNNSRRSLTVIKEYDTI